MLAPSLAELGEGKIAEAVRGCEYQDVKKWRNTRGCFADDGCGEFEARAES